MQMPDKVYKFMEPKYLKLLRETADIRINFLKNFEGITKSSIYLDEYNVVPGQTSDLERQILSAHGISVDSTSSVSLSNVTLSTTFIDTNYFVYCVCLENSKGVQKHFGNGLQEIFDFPNFIKGLTSALQQKSIVIHDMGPCIYLPKREQKFDASDLTDQGKKFVLNKPYFVKDKRYSYQKEYRVLWRYEFNKEIEEPIMLQGLNHLERYYKTKVLQLHNKRKNRKKKNNVSVHGDA
ncbi:hypothetical protein JSY36_04975 [Bacillus sp. H-16]|uniref:hypothetical protein n=1 Tax=Alteribacter salitolerans TaxID=2912333 RepID=UPI0019658152|nr:hypothetical protein [Alteribacter salitolerans]MBM7095105.1 hypothetical protein [Alteribacter salitolerans]